MYVGLLTRPTLLLINDNRCVVPTVSFLGITVTCEKDNMVTGHVGQLVGLQQLVDYSRLNH